MSVTCVFVSENCHCELGQDESVITSDFQLPTT